MAAYSEEVLDLYDLISTEPRKKVEEFIGLDLEELYEIKGTEDRILHELNTSRAYMINVDLISPTANLRFLEVINSFQSKTRRVQLKYLTKLLKDEKQAKSLKKVKL